jgi:hypothetical protein
MLKLGLAFVYTADANLTIHVVGKWDSKGQIISTSDARKAPTEISYVEATGEALWGYQIPPGMPRVSNFKLGLQAELFNTPVGRDSDSTSSTIVEESLPPYHSPASKDDAKEIPESLLPYTLPAGKDAAKVTEDYLRLLYEWLMQILTKKYASRLIITPIHFVLTVPAVWDEAGQQLTRKVARLAGIGTREGDSMELIKEPEAAALYAFKSLSHLRSMVSTLLTSLILFLAIRFRVFQTRL